MIYTPLTKDETEEVNEIVADLRAMVRTGNPVFYVNAARKFEALGEAMVNKTEVEWAKS